MENIQEYEDLSFLQSIVKKEYERRCLVCNIVRMKKEDEICMHCYRAYTFFAKSEQKINIFKNRIRTLDEYVYENDENNENENKENNENDENDENENDENEEDN